MQTDLNEEVSIQICGKAPLASRRAASDWFRGEFDSDQGLTDVL